MEYIIRDKSIITDKKNLEHLYTFKKFPVFMWCVDQDKSKDLVADMNRTICPESGIIQLDRLVPLDILYQESHNDWVGKTRETYYESFSNYITKQGVKSILEIWWGNWRLAEKFVNKTNNSMWHIVEPNPLFKETENIKIVESFFHKDIHIKSDIDCIVHSQLFEHIYEPTNFLNEINDYLKIWQKHIFCIPDLERFVKNNYTNWLNFEHTFLINEYFCDLFLKRSGFKVIDKTKYQDYYLFYTAEKVEDSSMIYDNIHNNQYEHFKNMFMWFIHHYENFIKKLNQKIESFDWEIYLFGWHIFSQYLLWFWLKTDKIISILDNSDLKNGKRLYWTDFKVEKPTIIADKKKVAIIVNAAFFQEEIKKQLLALNPDAEIWE